MAFTYDKPAGGVPTGRSAEILALFAQRPERERNARGSAGVTTKALAGNGRGLSAPRAPAEPRPLSRGGWVERAIAAKRKRANIYRTADALVNQRETRFSCWQRR